MLVNRCRNMAAIPFVLSVCASSTCVAAGDGMPGPVGSPASIAPLQGDQGTAQLGGLIPRAPIGHRQPRQIDVLGDVQLSPRDLELRKLDAEIDRKIIICRGC